MNIKKKPPRSGGGQVSANEGCEAISRPPRSSRKGSLLATHRAQTLAPPKHHHPVGHPDFRFDDSVDLIIRGFPSLVVQADELGRIIIAQDGGVYAGDPCIVIDCRDLGKLIAALSKFLPRSRS